MNEKSIVIAVSLTIRKSFCVTSRGDRLRYLKLRAQVLRGAASRVGPLTLRLREGAKLKGGRGSVNDTTPV